MKKILLLVVFGLNSVFLLGDDIIINKLGSELKPQGDSKFSGEYQAIESGFFVYVEGKWKQTGANIGDESILTFADDYTPEIKNSGQNFLSCTYSQIGWVWPFGGPTVSDSITFFTYPEVQSVTVLNKGRDQLQKKSIFEYQASFAPGVTSRKLTLSVTGSISFSWSESQTLEDTTQYSATTSLARNVSGGLKFEGLSLGAGQAQTFSATVTKTVKESNTLVETGSKNETIAFSTNDITITPEFPRVRVNRLFYVEVEEVTAKYYVDADNNGVADSSDLATVVYIARDKPSIVHVEELLGPISEE